MERHTQAVVDRKWMREMIQLAQGRANNAHNEVWKCTKSRPNVIAKSA